MEGNITDTFWAGRIAVTREKTLPAIYHQLQQTGKWASWKLEWKVGQPLKPTIFWDQDMAKFLESLSYALAHMKEGDTQRKQFDAWLHEAIDMIEAAQGEDGYINVYYTVVEPENRWTDILENHELYCAGHMLEAALAHHSVTRSTRFLDIMTRYMDYIDTVFGREVEKKRGYPGHQEIELALLRLYEVRPDPKYFRLAQFFIEQRGYREGEFFDEQQRARRDDHPDVYYWPTKRTYWYNQADQQIRDLQKIKGHSVRAMYYLTGVQQLARISDDVTLDEAVNRLWRNMVDTKLYIHGGIGAIHQWEGFGEDYELPLDCYAETCASIGLMFLGREMLRRQLRGEVAKTMELALYNDILGGVSLDGQRFFYNQPLNTDRMARSDWFVVSCCPPNLTRLLNSLEKYVFTAEEQSVAIHLYVGAHMQTKSLQVAMETTYPWEGSVNVWIKSTKSIGLAIRAPESSYTISLQGSVRDGYIHYPPKVWNEKIALHFDVQPRIIQPNPKVESTRGKLAVMRGPFVYALEEMDSPEPLHSAKIPKHATFNEEWLSFHGIKVLALTWKRLRFIPYFAWGNRQPDQGLRVWINEDCAGPV